MADEHDSVFSAARTASREGDIPALRALLQAHPEVAAATDADDWTLLHYAAFYGHCAAAVELLLAAAPATAAAHTHHSRTLLHWAAAGGHTAAANLLLAAAPATALAVDDLRNTPLHKAASYGDMATVKLLLAAAPATAAALNTFKQAPLHEAAMMGHTAVAQVLLAAAPAAAESADRIGWTPLTHALVLHRMSTARSLLPFGPATHVLTALARNGPPALPLFADFIISRPPLTAQEWALVPDPCSGLGRALPAALAHSPAQACQLVAHLPAAEVQRLRTAALCLARAQQQLARDLPAPVVQQVLGLAMS